MSALEEERKKYFIVSLTQFRSLARYVRNYSRQRSRLNPIIDYDKLLCSQLKLLGVKECHDVKIRNRDQKTSLVVFEPHNFPNVFHLNLAESYFFRFKDKSEEKTRYRYPVWYAQEIYIEFVEAGESRILSELLRCIHKIPYRISRYIESLLTFAKTSGCTRYEEDRFLRKSCLTAMRRYEQKYGCDRNYLTAKILKTLCKFRCHRQDLLLGDYPYDVIDYVLRCCTAAKFDIERYFLYDDDGKVAFFCPVTACIADQRRDYSEKLRVLLKHGFELQPSHLGSIMHLYMANRQSYLVEKSTISKFGANFSSRRLYILLLYLNTVCQSLESNRPALMDRIEYLFNSIPDAYICEFEVRRFLRSPKLTANCKTFLRSCATLQGGYTIQPTPRTLKHLSRCVIRKQLKKNFQIPDGIDALNLPATLLSYLRYPED